MQLFHQRKFVGPVIRHYLSATREAAGITSQRSVDMDNFVLSIIQYLHVEFSHGTAAIPGTTICIFSSKEYLLAAGVLNLVFV